MSLSLLPLTVWFFGEASLVGAFSNLVAVPFVSFVIVPLCLVGVLALLAAPSLATLPLLAAGALRACAVDVSRNAWQGCPALTGICPRPVSARSFSRWLGAIWMFMPRGVPARSVGLLLFLPLLLPARENIGTGAFEAVFIDVGQGLSVLVRTRKSRVALRRGRAISVRIRSRQGGRASDLARARRLRARSHHRQPRRQRPRRRRACRRARISDLPNSKAASRIAAISNCASAWPANRGTGMAYISASFRRQRRCSVRPSRAATTIARACCSSKASAAGCCCPATSRAASSHALRKQIAGRNAARARGRASWQPSVRRAPFSSPRLRADARDRLGRLAQPLRPSACRDRRAVSRCARGLAEYGGAGRNHGRISCDGPSIRARRARAPSPLLARTQRSAVMAQAVRTSARVLAAANVVRTRRDRLPADRGGVPGFLQIDRCAARRRVAARHAAMIRAGGTRGLERTEGGTVLEILMAGGWAMVPILICSAVALAIILERFWSLRRSAVIPPGLGDEVREWARTRKIDPEHLERAEHELAAGRVARRGALRAQPAARDHQGTRRGYRPPCRASARAVSQHARHHRADRTAARPSRHGVRSDQDVLRGHDQRRRRSDEDGRRHRRGAGLHGGRSLRRDPGLCVPSVFPRTRRRSRRRDGKPGVPPHRRAHRDRRRRAAAPAGPRRARAQAERDHAHRFRSPRRRFRDQRDLADRRDADALDVLRADHDVRAARAHESDAAAGGIGRLRPSSAKR